jgi:hypothetical protein
MVRRRRSGCRGPFDMGRLDTGAIRHGAVKSEGRFAIAATMVAVAIIISPIGIRLATGRLDLSPRVIILSLIFDAGLLIVAATVLSWGRIRHGLLLLLVTISPLLLLAAVEAGAIAVRLADRVAPLEDLSTLVNKNGWPGHFMSSGRKVEKGGLLLYRPWQSDGIAINELGLRTPAPTPKAPSEWRIAVTGASVAFGWRVRDADTIPVQIQEVLHRQGFSNVAVYNFAVDAIALADELTLLKRFRETYQIDQVVFLTGANDVTVSYMSRAMPPDRLAGVISGINQFELLKLANRLRDLWIGPSSSLLAQLDTELLPRACPRQFTACRPGRSPRILPRFVASLRFRSAAGAAAPEDSDRPGDQARPHAALRLSALRPDFRGHVSDRARCRRAGARFVRSL